MKNFTPRQLLREGFKELLTRAAEGEDVFISLPVGNFGRGDSATTGRSVQAYGAKVASKRFKLVAEDI